MLIAIVVLGGATGSGASKLTREGHASRTLTVCAANRQMLNLNKFVFLVRIPWFVYLRVRIPWVRIPLVRIPLGGIPKQQYVAVGFSGDSSGSGHYNSSQVKTG